MFVYTKNKNTIKRLEADGCKLIQKKQDGVHVYALSPTSTLNFEKEKNTWLSPKLTF